MGNTKIVNGRLLVEEGNALAVKNADLYVRDHRISFVPFKDGEQYEVYDAKDRLVSLVLELSAGGPPC